ncbi:UDP-glucose dehydrogenase family protein [Bacillus tuaregi]|uniref:UDP-glucose dehydrogenase family protein n=1 Tax=Bacillus tuaregi TaxID=1816695 RepID=UPI0008F84BC8|nr:UDP-glucose/GDP-mannose dehydrogenase family protein [Bacillus tuaregi]
MKIAVLGTGYVGLSTGVCLSEIGHSVCCIDVDEAKINRLRQGLSPIYEPGLEDLLVKNTALGRLHFTTSHKEAIETADIIIIAVGTPQGDDGAADLSYLVQAAKDLSAHMKPNTIVVIKSTVPVGTNDYVKCIIEEHTNTPFKMVSNPEFLRQGSAVKDTMKADRIVIGSQDKEAALKIQEMYRPLGVPILLTNVRSAEMIKYASNAFLATKISFINEISNLCEAVGANIIDVADGMGRDNRIGAAFLQAGIGYGGSCFPKDVKALLHTADSYGISFDLLKNTISINESQKILLYQKACKVLGSLKNKKIALLGLSFKPETDDMREAPSINIAHLLRGAEAQVVAYDPVATENAKKVLGNTIEYASSIEEAIDNADALFLVTEWQKFKQLDLVKVTQQMKQPLIFDGRNCFSEEKVRACPRIEYYPIGKPAIITGKDEIN